LPSVTKLQGIRQTLVCKPLTPGHTRIEPPHDPVEPGQRAHFIKQKFLFEHVNIEAAFYGISANHAHAAPPWPVSPRQGLVVLKLPLEAYNIKL